MIHDTETDFPHDRLARDGFATTALLDRPLLLRTRRLFDDLALDEGYGFYASPCHDWGPVARQIDLDLREVLAPRAAELLPNHEIFCAGFTAKEAGGPPIRAHQDWTYTDERVHRTVFFWCPLVDADRDNGGLEMIGGSHHWSSGIRPSRRSDDLERPLLEPWDELHVDLLAKLEAQPLLAGDAVAFDPATLHGSHPNNSASARPAITLATRPKHAELVHFHEDTTGRLMGWRVDDAFPTLNRYGFAPPRRAELDPWTTAVRSDELAAGAGITTTTSMASRRDHSQ